jgi:hypothetical protein
MRSLPFGGSSIQRSERNVGAAFIHDHQAFGVHLLHLLTPLDSLFLTTFTGTRAVFFCASNQCA